MYTVIVGDKDDSPPINCNFCWLCQEQFAICNCCTKVEEKHIPKYYCPAYYNQTIDNIYERPDWCPIVEVKDGL